MKLTLSWFLIFGICLASFCDVCLGKYFRHLNSLFSPQNRVFSLQFLHSFSKGGRTIQTRRYRYRSSIRRIACATPNITNGYFMKRRDILWTFYCDPNFKLIGKMRLSCKDGRFEDEIPICASLCSTPPRFNQFANKTIILFVCLFFTSKIRGRM